MEMNKCTRTYARKAFEELGYQKYVEDGNVYYDKEVNENWYDQSRDICFNLKEKTVYAEKYEIYNFAGKVTPLTVAEIKAIYEQMEEWGWLK